MSYRFNLKKTNTSLPRIFADFSFFKIRIRVYLRKSAAELVDFLFTLPANAEKLYTVAKQIKSAGQFL